LFAQDGQLFDVVVFEIDVDTSFFLLIFSIAPLFVYGNNHAIAFSLDVKIILTWKT